MTRDTTAGIWANTSHATMPGTIPLCAVISACCGEDAELVIKQSLWTVEHLTVLNERRIFVCSCGTNVLFDT